MTMDAQEFYDLAVKPAFGETMAFQVKRNQVDEKSFSKEALEATALQMARFMAARTIARWESTGKAPRLVSATVTLDWDIGIDDTPDPPWHRAEDGEPPDGAHRRMDR